MGSKVKGNNIYLEIWTGAWTKVGGQKDITLDRAAGGIDTTDKDSGGWEESLPGNRNWGISFDAFHIENANDPGFLQFETHYEEQSLGRFRFTTPLNIYTGYARIEGLSQSGPQADASVISFTLKGTGALVKS